MGGPFQDVRFFHKSYVFKIRRTIMNMKSKWVQYLDDGLILRWDRANNLSKPFRPLSGQRSNEQNSKMARRGRGWGLGLGVGLALFSPLLTSFEWTLWQERHCTFPSDLQRMGSATFPGSGPCPGTYTDRKFPPLFVVELLRTAITGSQYVSMEKITLSLFETTSSTTKTLSRSLRNYI